MTPGGVGPPLTPTAAVVSWPSMPDTETAQFHRAVLALNGGPSDARIVRLVASLAAKTKAELIAVHVVEIDWTLPLDAGAAQHVLIRAVSPQRVPTERRWQALEGPVRDVEHDHLVSGLVPQFRG